MIPNADAAGRPALIDDDLKAFLEGGVSVVLGTRDEARVPEIVRGWGPHVSADRCTVYLCVPAATSVQTRANLVANGRIAATFSLPSNYRTVQLKGRYAGATNPSADDLCIVDGHRKAFAHVNESIGLHRAGIEAFWNRELVGSAVLVRIHFVVEEIFNQTPGPSAGSAL